MTQTAQNDMSSSQLFFFLFDNDILELLVRYSKEYAAKKNQPAMITHDDLR